MTVGADGDGLVFAVADTGAGFDGERVVRGRGFQNMSDRVGAFGGTVHVTSTPGSGTTVTGRVPLDLRRA